MTHDCYSTKRTTVWPEERNGQAGYAVKYRDGYISWCPEDVYERDYNAVEGGHLEFGQAIRALQLGKRVRRQGWNGKGMWLGLQVPDAHSKMGLPYIYMSTVNGQLVPWLASQTDMLSDDWEELAD